MNVDTLLLGFLCVGRGRYIYDSREHWATTGTVPKRVRLWWLLKERLLIPRAAAVATVTDMIADALKEEHKIARPTVLINGSVKAMSEPTEPHEPLRLIHQGKFYRDRHLEDLIEAVLRHRGRAVLALQGWGEAEDDIRAFISARGAEDVVRIVPPVPLEEAVVSASAHDVGLIDVWPDSMSHRWAGSNKLFDYMGAGLAMVVTNLDFTRQVVEAAGCGMVVDPPTVDAFADAIGWLVQNPGEVARMKRNAVAAAPRYTWDGQAEVLYGLYRVALGKRSDPGIGSRSSDVSSI
jgi:glycosyltransferase involved in cell wall biosynthesis